MVMVRTMHGIVEHERDRRGLTVNDDDPRRCEAVHRQSGHDFVVARGNMHKGKVPRVIGKRFKVAGHADAFEAHHSANRRCLVRQSHKSFHAAAARQDRPQHNRDMRDAAVDHVHVRPGLLEACKQGINVMQTAARRVKSEAAEGVGDGNEAVAMGAEQNHGGTDRRAAVCRSTIRRPQHQSFYPPKTRGQREQHKRNVSDLIVEDIHMAVDDSVTREGSVDVMEPHDAPNRKRNGRRCRTA